MTHNHLLPNSIEILLPNVLDQINRFSDNSDFIAQMSLAFGNSWDYEKAKNLIKELANGNSFPKIEIVSASQINGGKGAFDRSKNTIYLSEELLAGNTNNKEDVFLEELGHYIDSQINTTDSAGDEGAIFAAIVQGKTLSLAELSTLKTEIDTTTAVIDGQVQTLELSASYGNITLDGNLNDWTNFDRLDYVPGVGQPGFELYGKYAGDNYVFAIKSDSVAIGSETTIWLNTDRNANTGYQIFGFAGGAEYNVNFFTDNQPYLYTGAAGENFVAGSLNYASDANNQVIEFAVPVSQLQGVTPGNAIDLLVDINNQYFTPTDYSLNKFTLDTNLPERTDFSKKVAIVFSETTANNFFDKKAYHQLFMSMQYQAMMAGIPFDILTEDKLTDINNIVNYDALIFPSFRNVQSSQLAEVQDTLLKAVHKYNIGIITAGDFLTNDENNAPIAGDSYIRMKQLLDITRTTGGGPVNGSLKAEDITHPVMGDYASDETIRNYNGIFFNTYGDGFNNDGKQPITLAEFEVDDDESYNALLATETGGRNVHFATEGFLGDNNLVSEALQWVISDDQPSVALNMSRDASIFISRNDMDQSMYYEEVPKVEGGLYDILVDWKDKYNFVGSYYINVGNNRREGEYTDWSVSGPLYQKYLALGNEIGTHSYTHPHDTNELTPAQLEFEFNQSKAVIEQQLGIQNIGAAVPGNPESLAVNEELRKYLPYVTGGYASVGAGYPGAFGFMFPGDDYVYFAPNMSFDFSLIGFKQLTAQQAEQVWAQEYADIINHADQPIILFPWHDYGPTLTEPGYTREMFDNFIERAYNDNTEFVTLGDLYKRITTFEQAQLFTSNNGNTITAKVASNDVGKFGLNITGNGAIASVNDWYAYDNDTVFLPKSGGEFTINLGATQDDATHIIDLPMRAELLSLTGDGTNLEFSFSGEGEVVFDLKAVNGKIYQFLGADSYTLDGEILKMKFDTIGQHTGSVKLIDDYLPTLANPIADVVANEDASNTVIDLSNVFSDIDSDSTAIVKTVFSNSNTTLLNPTVANNTLSLDYQPEQFGSAEITVRGNSNGLTVDHTFTVTVNSVNDAPTTTGIADTTVNVYVPLSNINGISDPANTLIDLFAAFNDVDNTDASLSYSITNNSNPNLFSATTIDATTGNLILDYAANVEGTGALTVRGTDAAGLYTETTFNATVNRFIQIDGNNNNNNLNGTDRNDVINGFAGDDRIEAKMGNDLVKGGDGKDNIKGGDGDDQLFGDAGNDTLDGGSNKDRIDGGSGRDYIKGGNGEDSINGDAGNDFLEGESGNDLIDGGLENDVLWGNSQNDTLIGGSGSDILLGGNDSDTLIGVNPYGSQIGVGEIDLLTGGDKGDRFVLGDSTQAYYNDGNNTSKGSGDYALIADFWSSQGDVIQLYQNASNYRLGGSISGMPSGTSIFLKTDGAEELIAIVQGQNNLNLTNSYFNFV